MADVRCAFTHGVDANGFPSVSAEAHEALVLKVDSKLVESPSNGVNGRTRAILVNLWVLALAGAVLGVVCYAHTLFEEQEPLHNVHAVSATSPWLATLDGQPDYLYVQIQLPVWHAGVNASAVPADGPYRRRLQGLVPAVQQLLAVSRRQLASDGDNASQLPALQVSIAQADAGVNGTQLLSVSPINACTTSAESAVGCVFSFRGSALTDYNASQPFYLSVALQGAPQMAFTLEYSDLGWLGVAKEWISLGVLLGMLAAIASERVHRVWAAFVASFLMLGLLLWCGLAPDLAAVVMWVDEGTMGLLFGMMVIVGKLQETGVFEVVCARTLAASGGRMWLLATLMMVLAAFISAWLDNVTTMLLMGPVTISMFNTLERDPVPLLISQALLSNIGGTATMVGDPPNIIIGNALRDYLGFMDFIINLAPGIILACIPSIALLLFLYRKHFLVRVDNFSEVRAHCQSYRITDWPLLMQSTYVTAVVIVGFLLSPLHHLNPAWLALLGATILCVVSAPMDVGRVVKSVEWDMLLFFAAQFVMVEAMTELGLIRKLGEGLKAAIDAAPPAQRELVAVEILMWGSAFASAIIDNIPYTVTMIPIVQYLANAGLGLDLQVLTWALAFGACLGGNGTLIGASANIVTASLAERAGHHVTFNRWLLTGMPVMIVSVAVANLYMLVRYVLL